MKRYKKLPLFILIIVLITISVYIFAFSNHSTIGGTVQDNVINEVPGKAKIINENSQYAEPIQKHQVLSEFSDEQYFSVYYQPRPNLTVGVNYNLEIMQIAAAHSAKFRHKGYVGNSSRMNDIVKRYFEKYPRKDYARDLYTQSMDGVVNKLYHGETDYILCYDKKLDKMIFDTERPDHFANQGSIINKDQLISVVNDFITYTKADSFFSLNQKEYEKILKDFQTRFDFDYVQQIQELTGINMDNVVFKLILSPSMEGGMALSLEDAEERDVFINITNPSDSFENTLVTLYHEGIHNFIVPVLGKKWSEYDNKKYIGVLNQNTGDNGNAFNETLTCALTILIIEKNYSDIDTDRLMREIIRRGWINTDKIYYLLKNEYIGNRDSYTNIEEFMPRIVEYLQQIKKQSSQSKRKIGTVNLENYYPNLVELKMVSSIESIFKEAS